MTESPKVEKDTPFHGGNPCFPGCAHSTPAPSPDTQREMRDFWRDHAEWSQATFGADSERGPIGPLRHLLKEVGEAINAWADEDGNALCEEITDCLLLVLDSARRAGLKYDEVVRSAYAKLAVNKTRKWPQTNSDQPVEHQRAAQPPAASEEEDRAAWARWYGQTSHPDCDEPEDNFLAGAAYARKRGGR